MKDYYKILDVSAGAKPDAIHRQYRIRVVACHPDKFTDPADKSLAEERVKALNEAYEVLKDPEKRARYDRQRAAGSNPKPRPPVVSRHQATPEHLHQEFEARYGDYLVIALDRPANVVLLDGLNYARYLNGDDFSYMGGFVQGSPLVLQIPGTGNWHLVVDDGGDTQRVRVAVRLVRRPRRHFFDPFGSLWDLF